MGRALRILSALSLVPILAVLVVGVFAFAITGSEGTAGAARLDAAVIGAVGCAIIAVFVGGTGMVAPPPNFADLRGTGRIGIPPRPDRMPLGAGPTQRYAAERLSWLSSATPVGLIAFEFLALALVLYANPPSGDEILLGLAAVLLALIAIDYVRSPSR